MKRTLLSALLSTATLAHADIPSRDLTATPPPKLEWSEVKPDESHAFNYAAMLVPGVEVGRRMRMGQFGWDANMAMRSVGMKYITFDISLLKVSTSGLWFSNGRSPFYVGAGAFAGICFAHLNSYHRFCGWHFGPEICLGKQFRTAKGGTLFIQAEVAYVPNLPDWTRGSSFLPTLALGTSF